ncbi:MAG: alpha/beta hydrolase [Candidatus Kariarchaeaceae archaeon]
MSFKKNVQPIPFPQDPSFWQALSKAFYGLWLIIKEILLILSYPYLSIYQSLWPRSIDKRVMPNAESFFWRTKSEMLPKRTKGVLFIHGFTSTPQVFIPYAKMFLNHGYSVHACRLAGHGTSPAHLASTNAADWYVSAREAYRILQEEVDDVIIVAHSLGTLFAVILSSIFPIDSLVLLSSPIKVRQKPLYRVNFLLRPLSHFIKYWPMKKSEKKIIEEYGFLNYLKYPLVSVAGLFDVIEVAQKQLPKVICPVLICLGDSDEHIELDTLNYLNENLGSKIIKTWIAKDAPHIIVASPRANELIKQIDVFVLKNSPLEFDA